MDIINIEKRLNEVRGSYISSLVEKKVSIKTLWPELQKDWQISVFNELYIIVHSMAGSAGTFNLEEITDRARVVVDLFKDHKSNENIPDQALIQTIDKELNKLLTAINQAK